MPRHLEGSHTRSRGGAASLLAVWVFVVAGCGGSSQEPLPLSRWLSADLAHRSVIMTLVPGAASPWSPYNFNGCSRGQVLVEVPRGWRVVVRCLNTASSARHSCAIVDNSLSTGAAFPGAATPDAPVGLASGHSATFSFRASRPGAYRIACLVDDNRSEMGCGTASRSVVPGDPRSSWCAGFRRSCAQM
jgi:hypothetical protein